MRPLQALSGCLSPESLKLANNIVWTVVLQGLNDDFKTSSCEKLHPTRFGFMTGMR